MRVCILLVSIFFGIISISNAQHNNIKASNQFIVIQLPDYYKENGVVFNKDYVVGIEIKNLQSRFTPTKEDIIKTEHIFTQKYSDIGNANVDTKAFFCCWVRQYIGLIDINGNKNIIVQLVNNTKPRKINRLIGKNWETIFVTMLSDDFYKASKRFRLNIDTAEISDIL